jgi:hypothetical protein
MSGPLQRVALIRRLAPLALMPPAAFAVHQLRYWLAFGGHAGLFLNRQGHLYLHSLAPWLAVAVAIAVGGFLQALGRALGGQRSLSRYTLSFTALWLTCAAALVAIYASQELLEGVLATGHPAGLVGVFGYGGWWSVPAALAVGLVLAAAFHGARWALREVADRRSAKLNTRRTRTPVLRPAYCALAPRLAPLADGWSDRGPPR